MFNLKVLFSSLAVALFAVSCSTAKLPASDNEALTKYEREIACVKSPDISAEKKYNAAEKLFEKLDFTFIRDINSLHAVLGKGSLAASFDGDRIQYVYSYGNKSITAIFWHQGNNIVRSNILYKDASKPLKTAPKYLPNSARSASEEANMNPNVMPVNAIKE